MVRSRGRRTSASTKPKDAEPVPGAQASNGAGPTKPSDGGSDPVTAPEAAPSTSAAPAPKQAAEAETSRTAAVTEPATPAARSPEAPAPAEASRDRAGETPSSAASKAAAARTEAARDGTQGSGAGAPPSAPGAVSRSGFGTGLLGGVIGGAAAAAVVVVLLQPDEANELAALAARVESTAAAAEGQSGRLDDLAGQVAALEATPSPDADWLARLDALEAVDVANRLDAIESTAAPSGQADLGAELNAIDGRLARLENELTVAGSEGIGGAPIAAFEDRVAALEAAIAATDTTLDQGLAATQRVDEQVGELGSQFESLSDQVVADRSQTMTLADEMASLATRVAGTETRLDSADDLQARATALALLTSDLDAAIARSEPYETTLQELIALGGGDAVVDAAASQLEPAAKTGIPSLVALQDTLVAATPRIIGEGAAGEDADMLGQATGNLFRLVTVRPVGAETEGDDAAAAVARAEARLVSGDLAAAIAEIEALEGEPATAAADWLQSARLRRDAGAALDTLRGRTRDLLTATP